MANKKIYDLIIIGGGPAGVTASIYASRENLKTLLVTKDFLGEMSHALLIENYPGFKEISGIDLIKKFKEHLEKFPVERIEGRAVVEISKENSSFEIELDNHSKFYSKSVIIATGGMSRKLNIPKEDEFESKGLSYCPTCDGFLYKDKNVAVVGGGNSGLLSALYLSRIAKKVYLIEARKMLSAFKSYQEKIKKLKNVEIFLSSNIKEIKGKEKVEGIVLESCGKEKEISLDGIFVQIGYVPVVDFAEKILKLDKNNQIIVNPLTMETSCPGIFAAGDVNNTLYKQIVIAASQGATAALSASNFLRKNE